MLQDIYDFHALTTNKPVEDADTETAGAAAPAMPYKLYRKAYPRFPIVELADGADSGLTLHEALENRESARDFAGTPVEFGQLNRMLSSVRVTDRDRFPEKRSYASAGALFPVEIYLLAFRVAGLETDMAYHLNLRINALEALWTMPDEWERADLVSPDLTDCGAAIVLTSVLPRSAAKYGEKAYAFSYIEAGLILQNLTLASSGLDIGACPVGGFIDDAVSDVLDLPADEIPLSVLAVGNRQ